MWSNTASSLATTCAMGGSLLRGIGILALASVLLLSLSPESRALAEPPVFSRLQERLVADGLDAQFIQSLYDNPSVKLETELLAANLRRSEATLNYDVFLTPTAVARAARYMQQYRPALEEAQRRHGVPPQVIVAIIMVETALGEHTGKYPTFNLLSTMAVADDPEVRALVLDSLTPEDRKLQSDEVVTQKLQRRIGRGYTELKALIDYARQSQSDPLAVRGSSEGAIGIPQFLPSNISRYGRDGDGDGAVDLFKHEDAIASIACFLEQNQWRQAHGVRDKKRVLLTYNRSSYYVNTVYDLARRLKHAKIENGPPPGRAETNSTKTN
ncbi:MAG TPA: lytic murein transglycosylase [Syntrophobacteria bacterium]|nr:lytic murein transglycosylase [Syntrophobacteria bacterium]